MMSPRLPLKPASEAIVVVLTTNTAAVRMPTKISGSASGSSMRARICHSLSAHPPRGVDQVRVDAVDAEIRVRDDRRHRQDHERELDDRQAESEERVADREHRQARQRAADVARC